MKKTLVLMVVAILASSTLCAQARALGGRSFYIGEALSYQHQLTEKSMLEAELGLSLSSVGVEAVVTHDWLFPITSWQKRGTWNWYAGVGLGAGAYLFSNTTIGVAGRIGIEYNFDFPMQLALDYRPLIGPAWNGVTVSFNGEGLIRSAVGLSLRYLFQQQNATTKAVNLNE